MNNIKKLLPLLGVGFLVTSCNNNGHITRITFSETNYETAKVTHTQIKNNQLKDEKSTLFNSGKSVYRYSFSANGIMRYDDYTLHNVNLSFSAQINFYWNLEKNYIKIEGENEVTHYMFCDDEGENKFQKLKLYHVNGEEIKRRFDKNDELTEAGSIGNFAINEINYFTTLLPIGFSITAGLDGSNYAKEIFPIFEISKYNVDCLFEDETHNLLENISKKYKDENKGFYLNQVFGKLDDSSICATIKSRLNPGDFTEKHAGDLNLDAFASFKNNFISQFEFIINGEYKINRVDDVDLKIHAYMSEEVNQQTVEPDQIDTSKYIKRT